MGVTIKSKEEIRLLREGGKRLAEILQTLVGAAKPDVSTWELDRLAESLIFASGGVPAFKGYMPEGAGRPYPGSLCVSINDEVVHAIPRKDKKLKSGDIVSLDIGMVWPSLKTKKGLYTDMAVTIGIGKISPEEEQLVAATKESLGLGIAAVRPGARIGDISHAIQQRLEKSKLGIVRDLAGHGVGYELHEEPFILNYGKSGTGIEIQEGMVLAIEPMGTLGGWRVRLADDDWTFCTADGSKAAHFEHTIAVTKNGCEVLTRAGDNGVL